jgi:predicted aspartyl protease
MCKRQGVILVLIKIKQPFSGRKTLKKVACFVNGKTVRQLADET